MKYANELDGLTVSGSESGRLNKPYQKYFLAVFLVYLFLVFAGVHTSSVGILEGEDIRGTVTYFGKPQSIRSDEFLRSTPILLGQIKHSESKNKENKKTITTPFDANYSDNLLIGDNVSQRSGIPSAQYLYTDTLNIDDRILSALPLQQEYVARWWLNTLYLFIGIGLIFKALEISWKYSFLCGLLVWLSPPNQWWSLWPIQSVAPASLATGLFLSSLAVLDAQNFGKTQTNRSGRLKVFVMLLLSALFALRLPGTYQPWSIPTSIFFIFLTFGIIAGGRFSRRTIKIILIPFAGLFFLVALPVFVKLSSALSKTLSTVYPGARHFQGFTDFPHWSGPAAWGFQNVSGTVVNQSEFAIGMLIFIPLVIFTLLLSERNDTTKQSLRLPLTISCIPISVFLLWVIAPWSKNVSDVLLLSKLQPERIMQILGVIAPILFVLAVVNWSRKPDEGKSKSNPALLFGLFTFILTIQGSVALRNKLLTNMTLGSLWLTALTAALAISFIFIKKFRRIGLALLLIGSMVSVINVNPVVRGFGIFGKSRAMTVLNSAHKVSDGRWASDNYGFDSVTTGAGLRLLSGNQGSGPNLEAYHVLDPEDKSISIWNRGGSYVFFNWTAGPEIGFINPSFDLVAIQIDPCNQVLNKFDLSWIVSSTNMSIHPCLRYYESLIFQGVKFNIYRRIAVQP